MARYAFIVGLVMFLGCGKSQESAQQNSKPDLTQLLDEAKKLAASGAHKASNEKLEKLLTFDNSNKDALRWMRSNYIALSDNGSAAEYAGKLIAQGDHDLENYRAQISLQIEKKNVRMYTVIKDAMKHGLTEKNAKNYIAEYTYGKSYSVLEKIDKNHVDGLFKSLVLN